MNINNVFFILLLLVLGAGPNLKGEEAPRFSIGSMVIGTESAKFMEAGQYLLHELNLRTQVDPKVPGAWKKIDSTLKDSPPFLWIIVGPGAQFKDEFITRLQRFMASGGTILAEADGSALGVANLDQLRHRLFVKKKVKKLKGGDLLTRTFYIVPANISAKYQVFSSSGRVVWIESKKSLLLNLRSSASSGSMMREYSVRMGINIVLYTLTGNYKDDLTHLRYLMRRRKK